MKTIAYMSPVVPAPWIAAHGLRPLRVVPQCPATAAQGLCPLAAAFAETVWRPGFCGAVIVAGPRDAVRVFWINPVADLRVMNLLEEVGGRLCGSEFLFCHALDPIPQYAPPMRAPAMSALADPMCGPSADRAARIIRDGRMSGAEAVVVCRIPGASHCAFETPIFREKITAELGMPVIEMELPPLDNALLPSLRNRLDALIETARSRRGR